MQNTTHSNREKITEKVTSGIEQEKFETLIIASIETLKRQKKEMWDR